MAEQFPEAVFVTIDPPEEDDEPPYLSIDRDLEEAAKANAPCKIGVYQLVEVVDVVMESRIIRRQIHEPLTKKKKGKAK